MTDGCVHLLCNSSRKLHQQAGGSCQGSWYGKEKAGGTARPSLTKSHLLGYSPPASQAGRRVASLQAFGLIGFTSLDGKCKGRGAGVTLHAQPFLSPELGILVPNLAS